MEELIKKFLQISSGYGDGSGSGHGYGSGDGHSYGDGSGNGSGSGDGSGNGSGHGYGDGSGNGYGSGDGHSYGDGSGNGDGDGYGIESLNSQKVHLIDSVQTIITHVRGNVAKGFILQSDLTLSPCFVVKQDNLFAHGENLREAREALSEKLFNNLTVEERVERFKSNFEDFDKKYPAKDLFDWHGKLTGSCMLGRKSFCRDRVIDIESDRFTIHEFIKLTENAYRGDIIKQIPL